MNDKGMVEKNFPFIRLVDAHNSKYVEFHMNIYIYIHIYIRDKRLYIYKYEHIKI